MPTPTTSSSRSLSLNLNQYLQTSQQKSYFVVAVTLAIVVLVIVVGILPAYSAIVSQRRENRKRDEGIAQLETVIAQYKNFLAQENELSGVLGLFDSVFPTISPQDQVVREMVSMTTDTSVSLDSINFSESAREADLITDFDVSGQVQSQTVTVVISGSRQQILDFITRLETSKRIYNVTNVSIARTENLIENNNEFLGSVSAEYYWVDTSQNVDDSLDSTGANQTPSLF